MFHDALHIIVGKSITGGISNGILSIYHLHTVSDASYPYSSLAVLIHAMYLIVHLVCRRNMNHLKSLVITQYFIGIETQGSPTGAKPDIALLIHLHVASLQRLTLNHMNKLPVQINFQS